MTKKVKKAWKGSECCGMNEGEKARYHSHALPSWIDKERKVTGVKNKERERERRGRNAMWSRDRKDFITKPGHYPEQGSG